MKRHRQSVDRAARNQAIRSRVRNEVRELRDALAKKEVGDAETQLAAVIRTIGKAVTKGVLHRNAASRHVARLSRQLHSLKKAAS
ncbi:MAG: 30S ribosomal protein S20 [Deltaproteobacteria bacterium]|nr:30S ribosomal protein S20 [Deltaproteobacteria bacterium]